MRVLALWEPAGLSLELSNPYAGLLARAMAPLGVETIAASPESLTEAWLCENRDRFQVMHLHWPSTLYSSDTLEKSAELCSEALDIIMLAKSFGWKIVWTMHNLYPHESNVRHLDRIARLAITSSATAVIVHCDHARGLLSQEFHRDRGVFVIPHGHFIDPYPNRLKLAEARRRFGFTDEHFVYLFFGYIRANKGVEQLLDSFALLSAPNFRLLLAARVCSEYSASLAATAKRGDPRIMVRESEFYANEEFQVFYNAADVAVFPFTDILTSGSAITALSFECPVIVPSIGCLSETFDQMVGEVYDPRRPGALEAAMLSASRRQRAEYVPGIRACLQKLSWESIAQRTLEAYQF